MSDACTNCPFLRTFNVIKRGSTTPLTVCARNAPTSGAADQDVTGWPEIRDPNNWWCGDGVDITTGRSFSPNPLATIGAAATPILFGTASAFPLTMSLLSAAASGYYHVRQLQAVATEFIVTFSTGSGKRSLIMDGGFYDTTANIKLISLEIALTNTATTVSTFDRVGIDFSGDMRLDATHAYGVKITGFSDHGDLTVTVDATGTFAAARANLQYYTAVN